jgi:hypothetical protein
MDKVAEKLDKLSDQIAEVKETVIRMEAADHKSEIAKIDARLLLLEAGDHRRSGERSSSDRLVDLMFKLAPWLLPCALAVWMVLGEPRV